MELAFLLLYILFFLPITVVFLWFQWRWVFGTSNSLLHSMISHINSEDLQIVQNVRSTHKIWFILAVLPFVSWLNIPFVFILVDGILQTEFDVVRFWLDNSSIISSVVIGSLVIAMMLLRELKLKQWIAVLQHNDINIDDYSFNLSFSERLDKMGWYILIRSYFHKTYPEKSPVYSLDGGKTYSFFSLSPSDKWHRLPKELEFDLKYAGLWEKNWNEKIVGLFIILIIFTTISFIGIITFPSIVLNESGGYILWPLFILFLTSTLGFLIYANQFEIRSENKLRAILKENDLLVTGDVEMDLINAIEKRFPYVDL